ncbi:MAG: hypothetical protein RLZZ263_1415 [Cyanobacteriota bacterium]
MIHRFPKVCDRCGSPGLGEGGYALPLALAGSLVLLLTALSTLSTTLHGRRLLASERSERIETDALASAAQQLTAALQGPYQCLLPVSLEQWQPGALPSTCPPALDPTPLKTSDQWRGQVRLVDWQPSPAGGELRLQWVGGSRQQRYALTVDPVWSLREVV